VRTYTRYVGGFAGNVGIGLARLGVQTAIISRVGDDGHGEFVRDFIVAEGIDDRFLRVDPEWPTPPTFCEIWPPDRFPLTFYRHPTAADWQIAPSDFGEAEVADAPILYASGTGLAMAPSRETTFAVLAAHRGTTIFDLDWRPPLWRDPAEYRVLAAQAVELADVVVGNEEEVAAAGGQAAVESAERALIVKRGGNGATLFHEGERLDVPGVPVEVVNGLGAGDSFAAALGYAILRNLGLAEGVRLGNLAGSIVAGRVSCSEAMPTLDELQATAMARV
jgi:5-dehydro-2-deoxygluconokinase